MKSPKNTIKILAKKLRTARERNGLTQSDVAKEMGYSTAQFVSNWERALSYPPPKVIPRLAKMYGLKQSTIKLSIYQFSCAQTWKSIFGKTA